MTSECLVCCDSAKGHPCHSCDYPVCRGCTRRCLEMGGDPACMQCQRPFPPEELALRVGKVYVATTYRRLRHARILRRELHSLHLVDGWTEAEAERRRLQAEVKLALQAFRQTKDWASQLRVRELHSQLRRLADAPALTDGAERIQCAVCSARLPPSSSELVRCALCVAHTCTVCRCVVDVPLSSHVCDPSTLESLKWIQTQCRPCVLCGAASYRESGCSVMWCVGCRQFWNWDTGRVISQRVAPHNPDHREWLQRTSDPPREVGDVPCGGMVDTESLHTALLREFAARLYVSEGAPVVVVAAGSLEVAQRLRHDFPRTWNSDETLRRVRVGYRLGDYPCDEAFAKAVERVERQCEYRRDVGEILEGYVLACTDVLQRFVRGDTPECDTVAFELLALRDMSVNALLEVAKRYSRSPPSLDHNWRWSVRGRVLAR